MVRSGFAKTALSAGLFLFAIGSSGCDSTNTTVNPNPSPTPSTGRIAMVSAGPNVYQFYGVGPNILLATSPNGETITHVAFGTNALYISAGVNLYNVFGGTNTLLGTAPNGATITSFSPSTNGSAVFISAGPNVYEVNNGGSDVLVASSPNGETITNLAFGTNALYISAGVNLYNVFGGTNTLLGTAPNGATITSFSPSTNGSAVFISAGPNVYEVNNGGPDILVTSSPNGETITGLAFVTNGVYISAGEVLYNVFDGANLVLGVTPSGDAITSFSPDN